MTQAENSRNTEQHTPGRLFLGELPVGERDGKMAYAKIEIVAPSQDPRYLVFSVARIAFSYEQKHKGFISTSKEEAEANARRLVACWNACEGMETDELEEIARTGGMLGPREDVAKPAPPSPPQENRSQKKPGG